MNYYPNPNFQFGGGYNNPPPSYYPLGYGGGQGAYFGNGYMAFNPYAVAEMQKKMKEQQEAYIKNQQELFVKLYKSSCIGQGHEVKAEVVGQLQGRNVQHSIPGLSEQDQFTYNRLLEREQLNIQAQQRIDALLQYNAATANYYKQQAAQMQKYVNYNNERRKKIPDDCSLFDYFNKYAGEDYYEACQNAKKLEQEQVSKLYDNNAYNNFMSSFNLNGNIDDMAIRMPSIINEQERAARRKAFIDKLMQS